MQESKKQRHDRKNGKRHRCEVAALFSAEATPGDNRLPRCQEHYPEARDGMGNYRPAVPAGSEPKCHGPRDECNEQQSPQGKVRTAPGHEMSVAHL
jgi:hypothetical protein